MKHLVIYTLMQPVGEGDLKTFLEAKSTSIEQEHSIARHYLHVSTHVHHCQSRLALRGVGKLR
jgi:hypothetical protein